MSQFLLSFSCHVRSGYVAHDTKLLFVHMTHDSADNVFALESPVLCEPHAETNPSCRHYHYYHFLSLVNNGV